MEFQSPHSPPSYDGKYFFLIKYRRSRPDLYQSDLSKKKGQRNVRE